LFVLITSYSFSQSDTTGKVRYTSDFVFDEGIYTSFEQFKTDSPAIRKFVVKKPAPYSDPNYKDIVYICPDSVKTPGGCELKDCWGYSYKGDVYIAHAYYSYYFKLMVIGSLCHFVGLNSINHANNVITGFSSDSEYQQFFIDFETGKVELFSYKNFSKFLQTHDNELYQDLLKQKKKKKIIFKYLLKYNEKHPAYIG